MKRRRFILLKWTVLYIVVIIIISFSIAALFNWLGWASFDTVKDFMISMFMGGFIYLWLASQAELYSYKHHPHNDIFS